MYTFRSTPKKRLIYCKIFIVLVLFMLCSLVKSNCSQVKSDERNVNVTIKRIAVAEFESDDKSLGRMLGEWTISVLMEKRNCSVIERMLLGKVLEELKLGLSDIVKKETASKSGELVGATHLLLGTVGKLGQKYLVTIKIVEVSSGETVESHRGSTTDIDRIPDLLVSLLNNEKFQEEQQTKNVSLQGLWDGYFQYDDVLRGYIKGNFSATFTQTASQSFKGDITEPWSEGFPKEYKTLHSVIQNGSFSPETQQISFIKIYDFDGHIVEYHGSLVGDDVVTGRWNIGTYTGSWRAIRRK